MWTPRRTCAGPMRPSVKPATPAKSCIEEHRPMAGTTESSQASQGHGGSLNSLVRPEDSDDPKTPARNWIFRVQV